MRRRDISKEEFTNFIVLRPTEHRINRSIAWEVRCRHCGREQLAGCDQLLRGRHTRCIYCQITPTLTARTIHEHAND